MHMAGYLPGESSHHGSADSGSHRSSQERLEEGTLWYFTRKEIEENAPSRTDGIDLKKETYLRKSYCTFLQDLGMRLKVPQVTIATAIIFCHRFFIRQSHAKNDRRTIATVCMFLAGKVEETPRPLKDVILVSYEIINKKDPAASHRIKQKEVYEQQKEMILLGERVVLATLGFDFNVQHPYKPLVEAIKKFKVAQNALAQVAWNFVNDGLRTSLCLQFKPHHIAAGAIFLAAKFLKVKLPSDGEKVWWQEFNVTPRQLEEVSNQMLELYEQNRVPQSQGSEAEGSTGGASTQRAPLRAAAAANEEQVSKQTSSRAGPGHQSTDNRGIVSKGIQNQHNDYGSAEADSVITDHKVEGGLKLNQNSEHFLPRGAVREVPNKSKFDTERDAGEEQERNSGRNDSMEGEWRDDGTSRKSGAVNRNLEIREGPIGHSPKDVIKIDKDKVKAALEKRRKVRAEITRKKDLMDEDDIIERELEAGIELAAVDEKNKRERRLSWSKTEDLDGKNNEEDVDRNHTDVNGQPLKASNGENTEEGEMIEDASPLTSRKRKSESSPERQFEGKKRQEFTPSHGYDSADDGHRVGRDREHRRHAPENHF